MLHLLINQARHRSVKLSEMLFKICLAILDYTFLFYIFIYFCSWQNKSQSVNKITTKTTTIGTTASVQNKGHGTHAIEPKTPYKASSPKNVTNVSKRSLRKYGPKLLVAVYVAILTISSAINQFFTRIHWSITVFHTLNVLTLKRSFRVLRRWLPLR